MLLTVTCWRTPKDVATGAAEIKEFSHSLIAL